MVAQGPIHLVSVRSAFLKPQDFAPIIVKTLFQRDSLRAGARRNRCRDYRAVAHVAVNVTLFDSAPSKFLTDTSKVPGFGNCAAGTVAFALVASVTVVS